MNLAVPQPLTACSGPLPSAPISLPSILKIRKSIGSSGHQGPFPRLPQMVPLRHSRVCHLEHVGKEIPIYCLRKIAINVALFVAVSTMAQSPSPAPATNLTTPDPDQVIHFLNQSTDWYRHLAVEEDNVTDATDALFVPDDRQMAVQIVRLSFDFGRAAAQLANSQTPQDTSQNTANGRFQNLLRIAAQTDETIKQTQSEIDQTRDQLQKAKPRDRQKLQA